MSISVKFLKCAPGHINFEKIELNKIKFFTIGLLRDCNTAVGPLNVPEEAVGYCVSQMYLTTENGFHFLYGLSLNYSSSN